ncbi:MAG: rod shape-determining protein MreD [Oscillospiraceae bacterium]
MTRRDFVTKWLLYAVGLVPFWLLETLIFPRLPFPGARPMLLPLAAIAVAVREGAAGGAGYGLFVGLIADAVYPGVAGGMTFGLTLAGAASGGLAQYVLRQNYLSCLLCALTTLLCMGAVRVASYLTRGAALGALLGVAVPEILWSLVFTLPVYGVYRLISDRVGRTRLR